MLGAAVSSPVIAMMTANWNRKYLLTGLMSLLAIAATTCALSPEYSILLLGRVLSSFSHAAYMGVGSVAAGNLFPEAEQGHAVSLFFTGISLSNIVGVPLDTLLGKTTVWRNIFWPIVGLAALSLLGITSFLPKSTQVSTTDFKKELTIFKKREVWTAFAVSALGYSGMLASHTYFSEMMINLAGFSKKDMSWMTVVYGAGAVLGNIAGGKAADKNLLHAVIGLLSLLVVVLTAFTFTVYHKIPAVMTLFANGFAGFSLIAPLMGYTISKAPEGSTLAPATNISAFGIGIALGIYLGGLAIDNGLGYQAPNWVGASLTSLGLLTVLVAEYSKQLPCTRFASVGASRVSVFGERATQVARQGSINPKSNQSEGPRGREHA